MPNYRRNYVKGGSYFFTVNLQNRRKTFLVDHIQHLRQAVAKVKAKYPFEINAWVVLPDHLHTVWTLPDGDDDYSTRWRLIKQFFSKAIDVPSLNLKRGEKGIWQHRFWEHTIRGERDYRHHVDYVHINPLKHGLVERVIDWPYSSFHRDVERGIYLPDWCSGEGVRERFLLGKPV